MRIIISMISGPPVLLPVQTLSCLKGLIALIRYTCSRSLLPSSQWGYTSFSHTPDSQMPCVPLVSRHLWMSVSYSTRWTGLVCWWRPLATTFTDNKTCKLFKIVFLSFCFTVPYTICFLNSSSDWHLKFFNICAWSPWKAFRKHNTSVRVISFKSGRQRCQWRPQEINALVVIWKMSTNTGLWNHRPFLRRMSGEHLKQNAVWKIG